MKHPQNDLNELGELTEENLDFSALSDGLGFHTKKQRVEQTIPTPSTGTGAILAGPVRISPSIAAIKPKPEKAAWLEPAASQSLRSGAFLADLFFVTAPLALACKISFTNAQILSLLKSDGRIFVLFYFSMLAVYFLLSESFGGQSLGKILFGLRIVEDDKYEKPIGFWLALARLPALLLGTMVFGIGLLSSFTDSKARPWQDKVTGSIVRRKD